MNPGKIPSRGTLCFCGEWLCHCHRPGLALSYQMVLVVWPRLAARYQLLKLAHEHGARQAGLRGTGLAPHILQNQSPKMNSSANMHVLEMKKEQLL